MDNEKKEQPQLTEQLAAELIATRQKLAEAQQQLAAAQAAAQQQAADEQQLAAHRYGQMVKSVEEFMDGRATVADVVKNISANVAQNDTLWKGALVGAAAAVLLTSNPVRESMGKTVSSIFPGLKESDGQSPATAKNKE